MCSSDLATVTVNTSPVITGQPQGQTLAAGSALVLTVTATGTPTPTYVWKKDGTAISGATQASYSIASAQPANAGSYTVEVVNSVGTVSSTAAAVTVVSAPVITKQPLTQTVNLGGRGTLTVTATGTAPLGYQWRRDRKSTRLNSSH